uniref:Uncharacterized protein n=1 Tax=Siphoviridae sp. ctPJ52 TaxID=2825483 RepID=A0A8S5USD4_9CAUD|nr:MAG TPA: hypothetical protein [Siphoviridae sp. ctPJ52]
MCYALQQSLHIFSHAIFEKQEREKFSNGI